jgi:Putative collagen-binding domain of a collagenase
VASDNASTALVYFSTRREITVDTRAVNDGQNVRPRWYDPTTGAFTVIANSEPENSSRSVSYSSAHTDGSNDWVLVVEGLW